MQSLKGRSAPLAPANHKTLNPSHSMNPDSTARIVRILLSATVALGLLAAAVRPNLVYGGNTPLSTPLAAGKTPAGASGWIR